MKLLREIDALAKVNDFHMFLEDLNALEAANNILTTECIDAKVKMLQEIGRGDYASHIGMARAAGYDSPESGNPEVARRLQPKQRLGLQPQTSLMPEKGQVVRYNAKTFKLDDTNGKIAFLSDPKDRFGGNQIQVNVNDLKPIQTKSGKTAWVYIGR